MRIFPVATIFLLAPLVRSQAQVPPVPGAPAPQKNPPPPGGGQAAPAPDGDPAVPPAPGGAPAVPPAPGGAAPGGGAPPQTTIGGQVPPVTNMQVPSTLPNGQVTLVQTVFTQSFKSVPSPFPSAKAGSIGMGTLKGEVGAVRTDTPKNAASNGDGEARAYVTIVLGVLGSALLGFFI
ncbi:MAG: hypothetical protein M1837_005030 [Sclerophora amabilis]|nr:MAG: hypothetical protein M1837_005030 [Sclerophora amabilis]